MIYFKLSKEWRGKLTCYLYDLGAHLQRKPPLNYESEYVYRVGACVYV